jgi:predicted nucleotidyltransferase
MNTAVPAGLRTDPVLTEAKKRLEALYGTRLKRAVLFGSRARGDQKRNSDYDVAVFLTDYDYSMGEVFRLAELSWDLQVSTGEIVSFKPFPSNKAKARQSLLSNEVERDGVAL